ncbi:DsbE family thiol:disulfide interchange protein [Lysobacter sp. HDW10]|uniref:DsbE family thiol:disulfide interchange protein n=1 Tax=Lysobacter sp. HDW10 TaxID=2714936 RepID=UPI0014093D90|nr:DsbE family thiol:disulfide interchange protein [Lysobacter sp. HDW10]QIK81774.1 DsbE family thiol:disulfide interchange protein [Lysobacter sp. HDW10]
MNSKRWLPFAIFLALAALLAAGVWMSKRADRDALPSPLIGKKAPEFALKNLFNPEQVVTLKDLKGAPFVLNVWGSWCVACREEHPALSAFAETKRVRVIGYNWKDEPEDAKRWLEQLGNPFFLVLSDMEGKTAIDLGVYGAPETYLIDAKGYVRWKHVGPLNDTLIHNELLPALARAEQDAR